MKDLIFCQREIPKEKWRYGLRSSAATGCGWIATYNALMLMGYSPDPEKLIRVYERMVPGVHGNIGTMSLAPAVFFMRQGFAVEYLSVTEQFDKVAKESDVSVLFYYWRKGLRFGAHFVALRYTPEGFVGYNTYRNSNGPDYYGESLSGFLKQRSYFGAVLIGIRDKKCEK